MNLYYGIWFPEEKQWLAFDGLVLFFTTSKVVAEEQAKLCIMHPDCEVKAFVDEESEQHIAKIETQLLEIKEAIKNALGK